MKRHISKVLFVVFFFVSGHLKARTKPKTSKVGIASYYHSKFNGHRTSSGERFSNRLLSAAHKFLPLGTIVRITNLFNHRSVIVKINDRLPQSSHRMIDLTQNAARHLHMFNQGLAKVKMEVLQGSELNYVN